jgi:hypothetical protein
LKIKLAFVNCLRRFLSRPLLAPLPPTIHHEQRLVGENHSFLGHVEVAAVSVL